MKKIILFISLKIIEIIAIPVIPIAAGELIYLGLSYWVKIPKFNFSSGYLFGTWLLGLFGSIVIIVMVAIVYFWFEVNWKWASNLSSNGKKWEKIRCFGSFIGLISTEITGVITIPIVIGLIISPIFGIEILGKPVSIEWMIGSWINGLFGISVVVGTGIALIVWGMLNIAIMNKIGERWRIF